MARNLPSQKPPRFQFGLAAALASVAVCAVLLGVLRLLGVECAASLVLIVILAVRAKRSAVVGMVCGGSVGGCLGLGKALEIVRAGVSDEATYVLFSFIGFLAVVGGAFGAIANGHACLGWSVLVICVLALAAIVLLPAIR